MELSMGSLEDPRRRIWRKERDGDRREDRGSKKVCESKVWG